MSKPARAGLFIYGKDFERLATFYEYVLGMSRLRATGEMVVLGSPDIQLIVHELPPEIAATVTISIPPVRRDSSLKFFFTVPSIAAAAAQAAAFGGKVLPEQWQGPGFRVVNALDPEGNVFHLRETAG